MEQIFGTLIIFLGIVNLIRMFLSLSLGEVYDVLHAFKKDKIYHSPYRPFISIVIAAYNEKKSISKTLTSIYESTYKNFEVVVIDDGSLDNTSLKVKQFKKRMNAKNLLLIRQKNMGKAHALNNGIKNYAKGKLIMSLDADSLIDRDTLKKVLPYFRNRQVSALATNVRVIKQRTFLGAVQYIEYLMGYRLKKAFTVLNNEYIIGGIGSVFRRGILKTVKYYDTDTVTEDIDLTMKIVARGNKVRKVIYGSDVLCFTQPVLSLRDLFRQRFRWKFGRFQTLWKNKKLFFNSHDTYTKSLTFLQLPSVLYSEFVFLFEPLFLLFVFYLAFHYKDPLSLLSLLTFLGIYSCLVIVSDKYLSVKEKIPYILISPFAYILFSVVSVVEYIALIKCIMQAQRIFLTEKTGICNWNPVKRLA